MAGMTLLAADQLDWYVGKPWAMIIDVRNRREYEKGHVKGAVNLPYDHLLERVCLPRDKILVICCERGAASMAEGKRLAIQHFFLSSGKRYGKIKQKTIQNQTTKRKRDHDMKYMFASDIHGSAYYCRKMLEAFEAEGASRLFLLGDLLYHGPRNDLPKEYAPKQVIAMLNEKKQYLTNVRGNCDAEVDQMVLEFPVLADYGILIEGGHTFYMSHGHIYNEQNLPPLMDGDIFLYGHTHVLRAEKKGAHTFLNPGSVSLPKEGNIPTYAILEDGVFTIKGFDGTVVKQLTL